MQEETATKQSAPWQDESWSEKSSSEDGDESIGSQVEWEQFEFSTGVLLDQAAVPLHIAATAEDIIRLLRKRKILANNSIQNYY